MAPLPLDGQNYLPVTFPEPVTDTAAFAVPVLVSTTSGLSVMLAAPPW